MQPPTRRLPIPGPPSLHRLGENLGAAERVLTTEDLRELTDAASKITVQGARYPDTLEKTTGR
ncbi:MULTISPECIES: hypothetical protein [Myxococcus]|uniref:hypothetical protein n=1 Tax=Myxococcus TaxID=32 RepID=UPI0013D7D4E6|nr:MULTISPECIES: hypothetical protein [Myxococcus]NVJ24260.1 hypothetical protein [Myxococcus sp. AM011]